MLNLQEIQDYEYRVAIHKAVPNVKILDDEPFLVEKVGGESVLREPPASLRVSKVPEHLKADWQLINEGIKSILIEEDEDAGAGLWICRGLIFFFFFFFSPNNILGCPISMLIDTLGLNHPFLICTLWSSIQ